MPPPAAIPASSRPAHRVRRVVTDRLGGVSGSPYDAFNLGAHVGDDPAAVEANRVRLAALTGVGPADVVWMEQIHGRTVRRIDGAQAEPVPGCDALVTTLRGLLLAVLAADCVPVLLADPYAGVVGAAHAGRPGVRLDIVAATVAEMVVAGADPGRIDALLGPAICGRCYEVPPEMQRDVEAHAPGSASVTSAGTTGLDLRAGVRGQLGAVGVTSVAADPRCTAEDTTLYSHRREGVTGRQSGLVWLERR
ncbi:peptidoglycan editing factor PgeF [soil metagenome]